MSYHLTTSKRTALKYLLRVAIPIGISWVQCICAAASPSSEVKITTLRFIEPAPTGQYKQAVSDVFSHADYLRFKYLPVGTTERPADRSNVNTGWIFSVTQNCDGRCSMTSSKIRSRILTARRVDQKCPLPYDMSLELLDSNEKVVETFSFSTGGVCFFFRGAYYGVAKSNEIGLALANMPFEDIFLMQ